MAIRINNLKTSLDVELDELKAIALKKINKTQNDCLCFKVLKQSVDARKKQVGFVYSVELTLKDENVSCDGIHVVFTDEQKREPIKIGEDQMGFRPVIIGMGPAGMFCALTLARYGYRPIVLERGADVDERTEKVNRFWQLNELDTETNVQFGEGGAGTFSDGKLTTRVNDVRSYDILQDFVRFGANEEILYKAKPHIGTDVLKNVVKNIRSEIIRLGGEVFFGERATDIHIKNEKIEGITTASGKHLPCEVLILAIGHSARDTYEMLYQKNVQMLCKPFSVGVRIEHLQSHINECMYGEYANHPKLKAADYQLSYKEGSRACYTFCMCPGGSVVAAASEENTVVTNGMSEFARDKVNANSAVCVSVDDKNFGSNHPLAGITYQRTLEKAAFLAGGSNYSAPIQRVGDFLNGKPSTKIGRVLPSYTGGVQLADMNRIFSEDILTMLSTGLRYFDRKIKGFADDDAILTGVETRTSAPVRIVRNEQFQSVNTHGLYPAGEGAGYAGGIMSAAIDGIKVAEALIKQYKPIE